VEAICDRVIIIDKGQIVADDKLGNLRGGAKDQHAIIVNFKEAIDINLLKSLKDVSSVEAVHSGFKLQTSNPELVKKQLLELAVQRNLNIISLQSESQSLEEIFKSLTARSSNKS